MDKVIKTQVIECETNGGGGLLVALGNDKFSDDFIKFSDNDYDSDFNKAMYDIDCKVWNFFEFDEYEWLQKPKDLIGKDICIHDQFMEHDDIIIGIDCVGNAEDYFNYKGA